MKNSPIKPSVMANDLLESSKSLDEFQRHYSQNPIIHKKYSSKMPFETLIGLLKTFTKKVFGGTYVNDFDELSGDNKIFVYNCWIEESLKKDSPYQKLSMKSVRRSKPNVVNILMPDDSLNSNVVSFSIPKKIKTYLNKFCEIKGIGKFDNQNDEMQINIYQKMFDEVKIYLQQLRCYKMRLDKKTLSNKLHHLSRRDTRFEIPSDYRKCLDIYLDKKVQWEHDNFDERKGMIKKRIFEVMLKEFIEYSRNEMIRNSTQKK